MFPYVLETLVIVFQNCMKHGKCFYFLNKGTVEPRYNEPPGITNDILGPGESYSKLNGIEPRCNEPRYNEFPVITNTIQKPKCKPYSDITNNMSSRKWSWMRNRWSILKESQLFVNILFIQWRTKVPNSHDLCYFIVYPLCLLSGEREREFLRSLSAMEDTFLRMQVTKQRQSKLDEFFQEHN